MKQGPCSLAQGLRWDEDGAMSIRSLGELSFEELSPGPRSLAILPIGATEAHGPHLPLMTDVVIAEAMAQAGGQGLSEAGFDVVLMPPISYSVTNSAAGFPGTITLRPATATAVLVDIGLSLHRHGFGGLCLANAHLEPAHTKSLHAACAEIESQTDLAAIFPDVTRKPWAFRLTDEFKSGACHAGCYEGSIVMAERPELVRDSIRQGLAANPSSLSTAFREGKTTFEEAGGPRAYFGDPAAASAEEGRQTIAVLGGILEEAVLDRIKL